MRKTTVIPLIGWFAVVLMAIAAGQAQNYSVVYTFHGSDGSNPQAELVSDGTGNFYGTATNGGTNGSGVVFSFNSTTRNYTVLHNFEGGTYGASPVGGVTRDVDGNLYGTTGARGDLTCNAPYGCGTVFRLDSDNNMTVLHSFSGFPNNDGSYPVATLLRDFSGNLYGTTTTGGRFDGGTVFKMDQNGKETVLHNFGADLAGMGPQDRLLRGPAGSLLGTTFNGGSGGAGTLFGVNMNTGHMVILYSFGANPTDAGYSGSGLIRDAAGNLYGTTLFAGAYGWGTVYKFDLKTRTETVLYSFTGGTDGGQPRGSLIRDAKGNLYGTTFTGGDLNCDPQGCGTVFKLEPSGHEIVLHSFTCGEDGCYPEGALIPAGAGRLIGTTLSGGNSSCGSLGGCGTIFTIKP